MFCVIVFPISPASRATSSEAPAGTGGLEVTSLRRNPAGTCRTVARQRTESVRWPHREAPLPVEPRLGRDGFSIVPAVLTTEQIEALRAAFAAAGGEAPASRRGGNVYGVRNALALLAVQAIVTSPALRALVEEILGPTA